MNRRVDFLIDLLNKEFRRRKERNRLYSLRAFAMSLDVDPSNLSKILNRRIAPKEKLCLKLASKLGFDYEGINKVFMRDDKTPARKLYDLETFVFISEWYHYAIMELVKLPGIKHAADSLGKILGIDEGIVSSALDRLMLLGLLKREDNRYVNIDNFSTSLAQEVTSTAHRQQQKQILAKAIDALETIPIELRSQSSMTMAINVSKLPEAKELIKNFRRQIADFLTEGESTENVDDVYNLSISLYPVTNLYKDAL